MSHFNLLRHAHTIQNGPPKVYQGRLDVPISAKGIEQCAEVSHDFSWVKYVVASPALRVQQTIEHVFKNAETPPLIQQDERLWEINNGWFSGLSIKQVEARDRALHEKWLSKPGECRPGDGENLTEMQDRIIESLTSIYDEHKGHLPETLIVTHGGVIRVATLTSAKKSLNEFHKLDVGNVSLHKLDVASVIHDI